jgi:hypothetical protein
MNCLFIQTSSLPPLLACLSLCASNPSQLQYPNTPAPAPPLASSGEYIILKPFVCAYVYCLSTAVATLAHLYTTPFAAASAAAKLCACFVNSTTSFAVVSVRMTFNVRAKCARNCCCAVCGTLVDDLQLLLEYWCGSLGASVKFAAFNRIGQHSRIRRTESRVCARASEVMAPRTEDKALRVEGRDRAGTPALDDYMLNLNIHIYIMCVCLYLYTHTYTHTIIDCRAYGCMYTHK